MSRIYDITLPTHPDLPVWPGGPKFTVERTSKMSDGEVCNCSDVTMCVHTGTHIDAPFHFVDGRKTTNEIPQENIN